MAEGFPINTGITTEDILGTWMEGMDDLIPSTAPDFKYLSDVAEANFKAWLNRELAKAWDLGYAAGVRDELMEYERADNPFVEE
jgi:hypothetical protein